ncbi:MAG: transglycosylase SLT domain-containing protein [Candidatus Woesearchaeota archaeon]
MLFSLKRIVQVGLLLSGLFISLYNTGLANSFDLINPQSQQPPACEIFQNYDPKSAPTEINEIFSDPNFQNAICSLKGSVLIVDSEGKEVNYLDFNPYGETGGYRYLTVKFPKIVLTPLINFESIPPSFENKAIGPSGFHMGADYTSILYDPTGEYTIIDSNGNKIPINIHRMQAFFKRPEGLEATIVEETWPQGYGKNGILIKLGSYNDWELQLRIGHGIFPNQNALIEDEDEIKQILDYLNQQIKENPEKFVHVADSGMEGAANGHPHYHVELSLLNPKTGRRVFLDPTFTVILNQHPENVSSINNLVEQKKLSDNDLVNEYIEFLRQSPEARALLLTIARNESGYNFDAKNPNSSAYGFFQIIDSTNQELNKKGFPDNNNNKETQLAKGAYLLESRIKLYTTKDPTTFLKELTKEELIDFLNKELQCEWAGTPGTCLQSRGFNNQYYPENYGFSSWEKAQEEFWETYKIHLEISKKGEDLISTLIGEVQLPNERESASEISLIDYLKQHPDLVLVNNTFRKQGVKGPEECREGELWFMEGSLRQTPLPEKANAYTCNKGHWDEIQTFNLEGVNLEDYTNKRVLPDTQQQQYKLPDYLRNSLQISGDGSVIFNPKEQWFPNYEQNPFSFFLIPEIDQEGKIPFYQIQIAPGVILTFRKEEGSFNLSEIFDLQREIYSSLMNRENIELNYGRLVKIELPYSEFEELILKNP